MVSPVAELPAISNILFAYSHNAFSVIQGHCSSHLSYSDQFKTICLLGRGFCASYVLLAFMTVPMQMFYKHHSLGSMQPIQILTQGMRAKNSFSCSQPQPPGSSQHLENRIRFIKTQMELLYLHASIYQAASVFLSSNYQLHSS